MADMLQDVSIAGYEILSLLGQGGMARVYRARQLSLNREVALKMLLPGSAADPQMIERFHREKQILKALQHPHILPVYDFGQQGDVLWIAMQLVSGGTLQGLLTRQPMPLPDVVRFVEQIGSALAYAHRQGVVHRDLKPENVLVADGPHLYLSDFGIAKLMEGTVLTTTGTSLGTPAYMSPEQLMNTDVDARTDIYALGVLTFQMVTGILPFDGQVFTVLQKHLNEPPPRPSELVFDLPAQVERAILKALEKKPGDRYHSAQEMVDALRAAVEGRQREAAQILGQSGWELPREEPPPPPEPARPRPLAWLAGMSVLAGAGLLAWGAWQRPAAPPPPPPLPAVTPAGPLLARVPQPLAYAARTAEQDWHLNWLEPSGATRQLHGGSTPRVWPDGQHVSFDFNQDVYALDLKSGEAAFPLTAPHPAQDYWGSVSPDGGLAMFHSNRHGNRFQIYLQKLKNSRPIGSPQPLTSGTGNDQWASFSPDGRQVAFTRQLGNTSSIHVLELANRVVKQLSHPPSGAADQCAAWSPDGQEIVFQRGGQLVRVDLQGRETPLQLPTGLSNPAHPTWAPAGLIAFASNQGLIMCDPRSGQCSKVVQPPLQGELVYPSWGPAR